MTVRQLSAARPSPPTRLSTRPGWFPAFVRDFAIVLAVLGVYFLLRGLAPTRADFAMQVTNVIVDFERSIGLFWEPEIQEVSLRSEAVKEAANFVYAYGHFPVLAAVGVWLWFRGRHHFLFMRDVMFVSMVIGLVFYYAVPAAPPRLMAAHGQDLGFIDTVFGTETAVQYAQPSFILNEYAAIPSFHFGWIALASAALWINTSSRALRAFAVALSVLMTWAIVASANHFFFDMALGGAVIAVSWHIARRIEHRRTSGLASEPVHLPAAPPRAA